MGEAAKHTWISVEDYLEGEKIAEVRHEYVNGQVFAMVGATKVHNLISLNLAILLRNQLAGKPCRIYMADVKVHIKTAREERFYYPDLHVECRPLTDHSYYSERPKLIIEVLSDSTKRDDRSDKFYAYRRLASLEEYVLVARDEQRVRSTAAPMDGMRWSMARKIAFDSKASVLIWPLLQSTPETRFCGFAETPRYAWYSSTEVPITLESFLALYGFQTGTRG